MPRLFTGLKIPPDVATRLAFLKGGLRTARWIDEADYHLTLRFIGDVEGPVANDIAAALAHVGQSSFTIEISGLGSFGHRKPHSLWAGIAADQNLIDLQADHERIVQRAGLPPEGRKFTPHITLARIRGTSARDTANWLTMRGAFGPIVVQFEKFVLFSAKDSTGGGPYVVEETYPLIGGSAETPETDND